MTVNINKNKFLNFLIAFFDLTKNTKIEKFSIFSPTASSSNDMKKFETLPSRGGLRLLENEKKNSKKSQKMVKIYLGK